MTTISDPDLRSDKAESNTEDIYPETTQRVHAYLTALTDPPPVGKLYRNDFQHTTTPLFPRSPPTPDSPADSGIGESDISSPVSTVSLSDISFTNFAFGLPYTLTFETIDYEPWATDTARPLHYLPVPLKPLPNIPDIPCRHDIPLSNFIENSMMASTIDEILFTYGYDLHWWETWRVYVSYAHDNGVRTRLAVSIESLTLITKPWAIDVWRGQLDQVGRNCQCEECVEPGAMRMMHGFEIQIVFPQGSEKRRIRKDRGHAFVEVEDVVKENMETFGGRPKLPFRVKKSLKKSLKKKDGGKGRSPAKKVRFGI